MRRDVQLAIEHATTRCNCGLGPVECEHCREAILRSEVLRLTELLADESRGGAAAVAPSDAEIENQRIRMVAQFRAVKVLAALGEDCHSLASECEKGEVMVAETFALIARLRGGAR